MIKWRLSHEPIEEDEDEELKIMENREKVRCTIFLGYTSNMVSCGMREYIKYLCQHKMIDAIVTTTGGIEEDFIKCLAPFYMGDFYLKGKELREKGLNRIGNLIVPNENYCKLEAWVVPIYNQMHIEQKEQGIVYSPSKIIHRLGKEINNEDSIYYWCYKNDIPVFCPAFTDGSLGDCLYFNTYRESGFIVDLVQDIRKVNDIALHAKKSGQIIIGGGVIKHHICNANLMRNGADFSVYVNTAVDFDGSDSGAQPDEAISWGKIRIDAHPIKVYAEATLVLPILVAETFARNFEEARRV
mmetsp:Transcript_40552/g.39071  ORF Transcript_40552/g.39071 Transcript_40552/m.39071 type:complete len:299 (+) Transcript_40552:254-1150(+)